MNNSKKQPDLQKPLNKKLSRKKDRLRAAKHQNQVPLSTAAYIKKLQTENARLISENSALKLVLEPDDIVLVKIITDNNSDILAQMNLNDQITNQFNQFKNSINGLAPHHEKCHQKIQQILCSFEKMVPRTSRFAEFRAELIETTERWREEVVTCVRGAFRNAEGKN